MLITKYDSELIDLAVKHFGAEDMQAYSDSLGYELLTREAIDKARTLVGKYQTALENSGAEQPFLDKLDRLYTKLHATLFPVEVKISFDAVELSTLIRALELLADTEPAGPAQGLHDRIVGQKYRKGL